MAGKHKDSAARYISDDKSLEELRRVAAGCTACDLYARATQTVFGEGPATATVMLVGEQPGDREDIEGHPFVGPAGKLLDRALEEAGIDRSRVFVTNAVKHFSWVARGKKRLHKKPKVTQIDACRPWLDAEIERVSPEIIIALGATAAQVLFGKAFRVSRQRGEPVPSNLAPVAVATVHPSSILRAPDDESRAAAYESFVGDLRNAAKATKRAK
jgi:DNA polymerase